MKFKLISDTKMVLFILVNITIFLFFSFFLVIPRSYSISALFIVFLSLFSLNSWKYSYQNPDVKRWVWYFLAVAIFWSISFDGWWHWNFKGDLPAKYAVAAICCISLYSIRISPRVLMHAISWGATLSFILAIIQFIANKKATGHTNAIRFGDISILMGVLCLVFSSVKTLKAPERFFFFISGCMGIGASFLSLSRGGWPFLLLAPLVFIFGFYKNTLTRKKLMIAICTMAFIGGAGIFAIKNIPALNQRIELATLETRGYFIDRKKYVNTSVGARLEQWRMSWMLGLEKPITGWGDQGVNHGRRQYVESGKIDASALKIAHTHHEFLEIWARRGLIGVICLSLIYIVPFLLFIPRNSNIPESKKMLLTSLCVAGMLIPIGYFTFGLSEVFFFLNIGNIFYIFSLISLFSAIQFLKQEEPLS